MELKQHYVVWNGSRTEGFITTDKFAAHTASTGKRHPKDHHVGVSSMAADFFENASIRSPLKVELVALSTTP